MSHNIVVRVVPNHAVYEYLEVHGGQFFHAPMTEIPNQVLPNSTFCRSVRVNSPSRFLDGYIYTGARLLQMSQPKQTERTFLHHLD